jgi:hypothetical protein
MKERSGIKEKLGTAGYVLACLVFATLLVIAFAVLLKTIRMETSSVGRINLHRYLAVGFVAFFTVFLIPRMRHNFRWLMKFTHEFTHLVFAILFFRKINRFKVDSQDSYVSYSNGWFGYHAITLSPYCVPLFTLALLPWRFTTGTATPIFLAAIDILIGFTYAFHVCCWIKQTRLHQTDITGPGVILSLLIIATVHILNFCLVVLTPSSGVVLAIQRVFWEFPKGVVLSSVN